jgi:predicted mannosyl-3-phosphoglycerate phosphatase (HAD superfamily)
VLQVLVNYARNYHIERLLLDESETVFNLSQEAYRTIVTQFVRALHSTRLQRVACVMDAEAGKEKSVKYLLKAIEPSIMLRSFTSKAEALNWLAGQNFL